MPFYLPLCTCARAPCNVVIIGHKGTDTTGNDNHHDSKQKIPSRQPAGDITRLPLTTICRCPPAQYWRLGWRWIESKLLLCDLCYVCGVIKVIGVSLAQEVLSATNCCMEPGIAPSASPTGGGDNIIQFTAAAHQTPFSLVCRSASLQLFMAISDTLLWTMGRHGVVHAMHYLDDYLILDTPHSTACGQAFWVG